MYRHISERFAFMAVIAISITAHIVDADANLYRSQDDESASQYWASGYIMPVDITHNASNSFGCDHCGDSYFYNEPPPDDIAFIPPPPMHPGFQQAIADALVGIKQEHCNFCKLIPNDERIVGQTPEQDMNNRIIALLISFLFISAIVMLYIMGSRRSQIMNSLTKANFFKSDMSPSGTTDLPNRLDKNNPMNASIANSHAQLTDPYYLQTNRDKNLICPIISDHVPHKKTAIPSKCWAQPGSMVGSTIRRVPNEYEVPSGTNSSAIYADMNNEMHNQRFVSPYNAHTYAEVREVSSGNDYFHTNSGSSGMPSESNYDNTACSHSNIVNVAPNGSVQLSDFNSIARPAQTMTYNHMHNITSAPHHTLTHNALNQSIYEQPPQRAQVIVTSNNQGVNPSLINYRGRIHEVI